MGNWLKTAGAHSLGTDESRYFIMRAKAFDNGLASNECIDWQGVALHHLQASANQIALCKRDLAKHRLGKK